MKNRKAVAPVLATLLMIAVAVAMSVIIFMWSQGFLSNTSGAVGGQQGAQNQAAQSSISIEIVSFSISGASASATLPAIQITVRNVGAVAVTLGSLQVLGLSANAGFTGSLTFAWTTTASTDVTETSCTWTIDANHDIASEVKLDKGASTTFTLTESGVTADGGANDCGTSGTGNTRIVSGDVMNVKVTTTVGTFATAQFTVP